MVVSLATAAGAYRNRMNMPVDDAPAEAAAGAQSPFMQALGNAVQGAIDTQSKAEALEMQSLTGKAELSDLVTAISSAELTLNTVVAVRDRVISAYQEILRMPM